MNSARRRHWKLTVIRALSAEGYHVATVRRTIGDRNFKRLLEQALETSPDNPAGGAKLVQTKLEGDLAALLERPITPWSRQ